jgi:hypothetical protein
MSKFTEALTEKRNINGGLYGLVKESLDETSFKDFEDAMRDRTVPHTVIAQALKSLGIEVSDNTVRRWRNK